LLLDKTHSPFRIGSESPVLGDLRHAPRQLRKTTAIFTLVHQVMLKPLPVTRPDELW